MMKTTICRIQHSYSYYNYYWNYSFKAIQSIYSFSLSPSLFEWLITKGFMMMKNIITTNQNHRPANNHEAG